MLEEIQKAVDYLLSEYLFNIEWKYGEGRAPFLFPAEVKKEESGFLCIIVPDGSEEPPLLIRAETGESLLEAIRKELILRYGNHFRPIR